MSWEEYVYSKRLEITCGEAPYLVSRYDVASGEIIPVTNRIGVLDRKIRVVTENTTTYDDWILWVVRAYQSTYGYEFQGDNLLIARINLMMTFLEYCENTWHRIPDSQDLKTIVKTITWNLWQMDGITGTIPFKKAKEQNKQLDMFSLIGMNLDSSETEENSQPLCRIFDWRSNKSFVFYDKED